MTFGAACSQFKPPLQELASAMFLTTLLQHIGHTATAALFAELALLRFGKILGRRMEASAAVWSAASHRNYLAKQTQLHSGAENLTSASSLVRWNFPMRLIARSNFEYDILCPVYQVYVRRFCDAAPAPPLLLP